MSDNCKERIAKEYAGTMDTLRMLWRAYRAGYEGGDYEPFLDPTGGLVNCPVCDKEVAEADINTDICKPCWDKLYNIGTFEDYGLSFDYVPEGTWKDQKEGYFRYQLSWGGPSDEFRFFVNPSFKLHRIEYWFLDWFDGADVVLEGDDEKLLEEIFEMFRDTGTVEEEYEKANNQ